MVSSLEARHGLARAGTPAGSRHRVSPSTGACSSGTVPWTVRFPTGCDRDVGDTRRDSRGRPDQAHDARVVLLAEVHREREAAVVHRCLGGQTLPPVQMAERDVWAEMGKIYAGTLYSKID